MRVKWTAEIEGFGEQELQRIQELARSDMPITLGGMSCQITSVEVPRQINGSIGRFFATAEGRGTTE